MREFIYFSSKARTSGNFKDLMKAGRLDIACHIVVMALFVSKAIRKNVNLHLFFYGQPDPPKHLEINSNSITHETKVEVPYKDHYINLSKKDISGLLKRMLYKYKKNRKVEALPGCFIEKKAFSDFISELSKENKSIYLLNKRGKDIRKVNIKENPVFVLGDHEGIPKSELKKIKGNVEKVSLGEVEYFSSQALSILQNELDRQGVN